MRLTRKDTVNLENQVIALRSSFIRWKHTRGETKDVHYKEVKRKSRAIYTFMHKMEKLNDRT